MYDYLFYGYIVYKIVDCVGVLHTTVLIGSGLYNATCYVVRKIY